MPISHFVAMKNICTAHPSVTITALRFSNCVTIDRCETVMITSLYFTYHYTLKEIFCDCCHECLRQSNSQVLPVVADKIKAPLPQNRGELSTSTGLVYFVIPHYKLHVVTGSAP